MIVRVRSQTELPMDEVNLEVGEVSVVNNSKGGYTTIKHTLEAMVKCMAGIGTLLRVNGADAQRELVAVETLGMATIEEADSYRLAGVHFKCILTAGVMVLALMYITKKIFSFSFIFKKVSTVNVGCQYSLGDVVENTDEKKALEKHFYQVFDAMTITSARRYLGERGFASASRKHDVCLACVRVRMLAIVEGTDDRDVLDCIFKLPEESWCVSTVEGIGSCSFDRAQKSKP